MKPEEVAELWNDIVDRTLIFTAIEELRALGYNVVHFISNGVDREITVYISFTYSQANDELTPIAITIEFCEDIVKKISLDLISHFVKALHGYVFSNGGESSGILIPISSVKELKILLKDLLPRFLSKVLGKKVKLCINSYELEYIT
jgi:hypothetical protein